ncbi:nuclear transport factor 2 family protein [Aquimarina algicola]|uniref:Nuclear transport factor 2 family protein n=1 Tax=Aquimarina algicola TaxID=2589995 RepID=A0A504JKS9_9FLAO|nr:nuclear transport factor 2 family protein [Aquimarina algicola]TPN88955.1 nuclear transport factor 2 family protein [Aquimarina algicola]
MKYLFLKILVLIFCTVNSQYANDSIENLKQKLLINIHSNSNQKKVINYDKSFVSDDKLIYESLNIIPSHNDIHVKTVSEKALVKKTLQNYIEGTSYTKKGLLKSAFAENATLYLTVQEKFKRITPIEYLSYFKQEPNNFTGRKGKILSIDLQVDIASAKVEILYPDRNIKFIDLFLLKKIDNQWKIISKTATKQKL